MRSFFYVNAMILTFFLGGALPASARAGGTTATCEAPISRAPDFTWLENLSRALASGAPPSPMPAAAAIPEQPDLEQIVKPVPDPRPSPSPVDAEEFDLRDPFLSRLQRSAYASAAKPRRNPLTGKTLRGIHVSKYLCYRGVKEALAGAGLVSGKWSEEAAIDAHEAGTLAEKGFMNIMGLGFDSVHAPLGAVLVYSGGGMNCSLGRKRHGRACGHIEIKTKANEYCSDYCRASPADQYIERILVGVYVKK